MNLFHMWAVLVESVALIAIIITGIGLMLCVVKPADALKHCGAVLGIVIVLMLIPGVLRIFGRNISRAAGRVGGHWHWHHVLAQTGPTNTENKR